jgi:hypothetical protein
MAGPFGAGGDLDRWLAPFLDALGHTKRKYGLWPVRAWIRSKARAPA